MMRCGCVKPKDIWCEHLSELFKADMRVSQFQWQIVAYSRCGNRKR